MLIGLTNNDSQAIWHDMHYTQRSHCYIQKLQTHAEIVFHDDCAIPHTVTLYRRDESPLRHRAADISVASSVQNASRL